MFGCKKYKNENISLKLQIENLVEANEMLREHNTKMYNDLSIKEQQFPLDINQKVYLVQLKNSKGRFTKTKASREHSLINEVTVDTKNYFKLVDKMDSDEVFKTHEAALHYINLVCVE